MARLIGRPEPKARALYDLGTPDADEDEEREEVGQDEGSDFLRGRLALFVQSSWLDYARYHPKEQELEIGYRGGWVAYYGDCDRAWAESFLKASSKGRWVHQNLKAGYNKDRTWIHARPYSGRQG